MIKITKQKKIRIIVSTILLIVALGAVIFVFTKPEQQKIIYGSLDQIVTLNKVQTLKIINNDISVEIKSFENNPCPKDVICGWSGLAVHYKLIIKGVEYDEYSAHSEGFSIWTRKSDYTSYATFSVIRYVE